MFFIPYIKISILFFKQSLEGNRHALDKAHYKKLSIKQNIDERDELIDQLLD